MSTDGATNNARTEVAFTAIENPNNIQVCELLDSNNYLVSNGQAISVFQVKGESVQVIDTPLGVGAFDLIPKIDFCAQNRMVISVDGGVGSLYMFDASDGEISMIQNLGHITSLFLDKFSREHAAGSLENSRGELFSFGSLMSRPGFFRSGIVRIAPQSFLPQLMLMMNDE